MGVPATGSPKRCTVLGRLRALCKAEGGQDSGEKEETPEDALQAR